MLRCASCSKSGAYQAVDWKVYLADDAENVMFCGECAARLFGVAPPCPRCAAPMQPHEERRQVEGWGFFVGHPVGTRRTFHCSACGMEINPAQPSPAAFSANPPRRVWRKNAA